MKRHLAQGWGTPRRLISMLAVVGVLTAGGVAAQPVDAAYAADYPSWQDVLEARSSEASKMAEISRLENLLAELEAAAVAAEAEAKAKGDAYFEAQQEYDEAAYRVDVLEEQVAEATAKAEESMRMAGQLAARLQRVGSADLTATLLFTDSDDLLGQLGRAEKVSEQSAGIFDKAKQDQNSAQKLSDQAAVAKEALALLATEAEAAMIDAQEAATAAVEARDEQIENKARLQAQLATLKEDRIATEEEYQVGEQLRQAELKRQRDAAARAAAEAAGLSGAPAISGSGWARPSGGHISSSYGWRVPPKRGASSLHGGVDLATGCGAPLYAASSGTVAFAGWYGGYGNHVKVNHGDGSQSAYSHIRPGGIVVGYGQWVNAGQIIAYSGTTGVSTGCHLHYEIRTGGSTTDPLPYLRARGVGI